MMARLNVVLLALLVVCALSLVTSRHQARKLFVDLEREQAQARTYDDRVRTAADRAIDLGDAGARGEDRARAAAHATARREPRRSHRRDQAMRPRQRQRAPTIARAARAAGFRRRCCCCSRCSSHARSTCSASTTAFCRSRAARATAATSRCPRIAAASSIASANRSRSARRSRRSGRGPTRWMRHRIRCGAGGRAGHADRRR